MHLKSNQTIKKVENFLKCHCNVDPCNENKTCSTNGHCYQHLIYKLKNEKKVKVIQLGCSTNEINFNNKFILRCKTDYCNSFKNITSFKSDNIPTFIYQIIFLISMFFIIKKKIKKFYTENVSIDYKEKCDKSSLYKELQLLELIKNGKFKKSYKGKTFSEKLFVKFYKQKYKKRWLNEKKVYYLELFRHKNIVGYVFKDGNKLMISTLYYPLGSLKNYLQKNNNINELSMIKLMIGSAEGLKHLHQNFCTKPSIAHRNLNSDNFIVVDYPEFTCKLTNFSTALIKTDYEYDKENKNLKKYKKNYFKTKYCPPEYFNKEFNEYFFEYFLMADIYSFSLILWQILNSTNDVNYIEPYDEYLKNNDDIIKQMEELLKENKRPTFNLKSSISKFAIHEIIMKSWFTDPDCRYSISNITKELINVQNDHFKTN